MMRPSSVKLRSFSVSARFMRYGKSKLATLYPVMMSASLSRTKRAHASIMSPSRSKDST